MLIAIHAPNLGFSRQGHAYVEYRMFSAISRFGLDHARLSIHLDEDDRAHSAARYRCSVVIEWAPAGRLRVRTRAERLYRAVDVATERLADRLERCVGDFLPQAQRRPLPHDGDGDPSRRPHDKEES
jgi:ribosome-associated translation inhibitor RaiA